MLPHYDGIVIFQIYGQFGTIKILQESPHTIVLSKGPYYFCQKMLFFATKVLASTKLNGPGTVRYIF